MGAATRRLDAFLSAGAYGRSGPETMADTDCLAIVTGRAAKLETTMPDRADTDERDKFDHGDHPTNRSQPGDLRSPSGGKTERPNQRDDSRGGVAQREPLTAPDSRTQNR